MTVPTSVDEAWELTIPGRLWLLKTTYTRQGHAIVQDFSIGPNKAGTDFKISSSDRDMNQERCADPENDPFRNGVLVRKDADQNIDPDTESIDAVTTANLMMLFDKNGAAFHAAVNRLGEIPIRRLREMAEAVDASAAQVTYLEKVITERFRTPVMTSGDVELGVNGQRSTNPAIDEANQRER